MNTAHQSGGLDWFAAQFGSNVFWIHLLMNKTKLMKYIILGFTILNSVLLLLTIKKRKMEQVSFEQFSEVLNRIDLATTNIANELRDIKDQVKKYGLPAEAEQNIFARLEAAADKLESIGKPDEGSPVTESPVTESPVTESPVTDQSPSTEIV